MSNWRPIETAPKGEPKKFGVGPRILGGFPGNGRPFVLIVRWVWYAGGTTGQWESDEYRVVTPTVWQPLPTLEPSHD